MAKHEFGIMKTAPPKGKIYDAYDPQKYNCITVDDIDFYWHSLDVPGKGIAYCGITLIPPTSMQSFISVIYNFPELSELKALMQKAYTENKWMIHFGL